MDLGAAFTDVSRSPKWGMTFLFLSICFLIPIVGPIVGLGYLVRRHVTERQGRGVEDFDFAHFGLYLKEGVWPFLISLLSSVLLFPLGVIMVIPLIVAIASESVVGIVIGLLFSLLVVGVAILVQALVTPGMALNCALRQGFDPGISSGFFMSFLKGQWKSLLLYQVLLFFVSFGAILLGYVALMIGICPAMAFVSMVWWHLLFQHYDKHVADGGVPVEINPTLLQPLPVTSVPPPLPTGEGSAVPPPPPGEGASATPPPPPSDRT